MSVPPIPIAIVGLGKIARDQHVGAIQNSEQFVLVATASPEASGLDGVPHFADLGSLLSKGPTFQACAVCTPPRARFDLARLLLKAGKHVLLEKPPGLSLSEVDKLEGLADAAGSSLFTAWHSRFAGGVAPAQNWLSDRKILSVEIVWRENVRVWHPGQSWIWQSGGFGVFDPGINALSILTLFIREPLRLVDAKLAVPQNVVMPIAAALQLQSESGIPISVDLDFRQTGLQTWDIDITTDTGTLRLANGGADLLVADHHWRHENSEYPGLYERFAELIRTGASEVDAGPLQLVADAFRLGKRTAVEAFIED